MNLLVKWSWAILLLSKVLTKAMSVTRGSAGVKATMASIETVLADAGSIDASTMLFTAIITSFQITSGAFPAWRTLARLSKALTVEAAVEAANS